MSAITLQNWDAELTASNVSSKCAYDKTRRIFQPIT